MESYPASHEVVSRRQGWLHKFRGLTNRGSYRHGVSPDVLPTRGYNYMPLDPAKKQIRLLQLQRQWRSTLSRRPLRFEMIITSISDGKVMPYHAISYAWREVTGYSMVVIDGMDVRVPSSAEQALRGVVEGFRVNKLGRTLPIWIDAICIHQDDVGEKSHQVAMMGDVFSKAEMVLVWWGHADASTKAVFKSLHMLYDDCFKWIRSSDELRENDSLPQEHKELLPYWDTELPLGCELGEILSLLRSTWFGRLWVVQEIALARQTHCFCGSYSMAWMKFSMAWRWVWHRLESFLPKDPDLLEDFMLLYLIETLCSITDSTRNRDMVEILLLNLTFASSNPHDRIFAIQGLLASGGMVISPDYRLRLVDVYGDATYRAMSMIEDFDASLMTKVRVLDALTLAAVTSCTRQRSTSIWPSWVPHYDDLGSPGDYLRVISIAPGSSLADNGSPARLLRSAKGDRLYLDGIIVGKVACYMALSRETGLDVHDKPYDDVSPDVVHCITELFRSNLVYSIHAEWSNERIAAVAAAIPEMSDTEDATRNFAALVLAAKKTSPLLEGLPSDQLLKDCGADDGDAEVSARVLELFLGCCSAVRLEDGMFCRCTSGVAEGDFICILFGGDIPFVMRSKGEQWQLCGIANVPGIMNGEYIERLQDEGRLEAETRTFEII